MRSHSTHSVLAHRALPATSQVAHVCVTLQTERLCVALQTERLDLRFRGGTPYMVTSVTFALDGGIRALLRGVFVALTDALADVLATDCSAPTRS
jgi:hypothetical protein